MNKQIQPRCKVCGRYGEKPPVKHTPRKFTEEPLTLSDQITMLSKTVRITNSIIEDLQRQGDSEDLPKLMKSFAHANRVLMELRQAEKTLSPDNRDKYVTELARDGGEKRRH